jgi:uncharacterized protein (TIGR00290 family)
MNWSGGKDSALCLFYSTESTEYTVTCLLTSVNVEDGSISVHGVRKELLELQSAAIGIPLTTVELSEQPTMLEYETSMKKKVLELRKAGFTHALFGDIFLEDLKHYREEQLQQQSIKCIFPLWKMDTRALMRQFISVGFKAIVVCVNENFLDKSFCGRFIDEAFVNDLPVDVDVCGENGEFHSFVFDGPIFNQPVAFKKGDIVEKTYRSPTAGKDANRFYFCDLLLA